MTASQHQRPFDLAFARNQAQGMQARTYEAACDEIERLEEQYEELQRWSQQVHDALDGRPLPEHPDEGPARIKGLLEQLETLRGALQTLVEEVYADDLSGPELEKAARAAIEVLNPAREPELDVADPVGFYSAVPNQERES